VFCGSASIAIISKTPLATVNNAGDQVKNLDNELPGYGAAPKASSMTVSVVRHIIDPNKIKILDVKLYKYQ